MNKLDNSDIFYDRDTKGCIGCFGVILLAIVGLIALAVKLFT